MKENLRGIYRSENGPNDFIANGGGWPSSYATLYSATSPYWYNPYNEDFAVQSDAYGKLYNWAAVINYDTENSVGARGLCPDGWHVPTYSEWSQLVNYVGSQSGYVCGNDNANIAKALSSDNYWTGSTEPCDVGYRRNDNNATDFTAIPAGLFESGNQTVHRVNNSARFWTSSEFNSANAIGVEINYSSGTVLMQGWNKADGYSVRCVRD